MLYSGSTVFTVSAGIQYASPLEHYALAQWFLNGEEYHNRSTRRMNTGAYLLAACFSVPGEPAAASPVCPKMDPQRRD